VTATEPAAALREPNFTVLPEWPYIAGSPSTIVLARSSRARSAPAARILAPVLPLLLVAGCFGGSDAPPRTTELAFAPDAEYDADHGAVKGLVTTVDAQPVVGADLLLKPGDRQASTAMDGGYVFSMIPPGDYTLLISRLGYQPAQRPVKVIMGEATEVDFELKEIYVPQPRASAIGPFNGFMECRWAHLTSGPCGHVGFGTNAVTNDLWTRDNVYMFFNVDAPDWEEIIFEARWVPSSAATNTKMTLLFSYKDRPGSHLFADSQVPQDSPLWFNYTRAGPNRGAQGGQPTEPDQNLTLQAWPAIGTSLSPTDFHPVSIAYEMRFEMMVTVFYNQRAPEGYTAWED
jgi:carboxypeptidase family protein